MTAPTAPVIDDSEAPGELAVLCERLVHVFRTPGQEVAALRGADLVVRRGEMLALLGPSGAGKTTLLWHLAGLLSPTAGQITVAGHQLNTMTSTELTKMRNSEVGVMLQNPSSNLLPYATALTNVTFPARGRRASRSGKNRWQALELLHSVGLGDQADRPAGSLSGGEQQRLALAVALSNKPKVLLADEPTSQLDAESAAAVLALIATANAESHTTVIAVTHDEAVAAALGRTVTIRDGRVGAEGRGGQEFVVVGRDGTVTLPPDVLTSLPPGSLAIAVPHEHGVDLRRAQ